MTKIGSVAKASALMAMTRGTATRISKATRPGCLPRMATRWPGFHVRLLPGQEIGPIPCAPAVAYRQMQLSTFLNLYAVACAAVDHCAEVCLEGGGRVEANIAMKTVLLTGGVGFIGTHLHNVYFRLWTPSTFKPTAVLTPVCFTDDCRQPHRVEPARRGLQGRDHRQL